MKVVMKLNIKDEEHMRPRPEHKADNHDIKNEIQKAAQNYPDRPMHLEMTSRGPCLTKT